MRNLDTKLDGDTLPADAFNSDQDELENIVTSSDQTLDPNAGPDTDLNMLGKAIAAYANAGNVYQDSGTANSYVLSIASNLKAITKYYDNMLVVFKAGNSSTGASTVNIETLGAKSLTLADGTALIADDIVTGGYVTAVYSLSNDRFEITKTLSTTSDFPQVRDKSRNLIISRPSITTVDIDASEVVLQDADSPPSSFVAQSINLTADITASGANGLDIGIEASDTWYYLWVIYNGSSVASLLSTSSTSPTMPSGYTFKALVGVVRNDSGSDFIDFEQRDDVVNYTSMQSILSTSVANAWTALNVSSLVPLAIAKMIKSTVSAASGTLGMAPSAGGGGAELSLGAQAGAGVDFGGLVELHDNAASFDTPTPISGNNIYYFYGTTNSETYIVGFTLR